MELRRGAVSSESAKPPSAVPIKSMPPPTSAQQSALDCRNNAAASNQPAATTQGNLHMTDAALALLPVICALGRVDRRMESCVRSSRGHEWSRYAGVTRAGGTESGRAARLGGLDGGPPAVTSSDATTRSAGHPLKGIRRERTSRAVTRKSDQTENAENPQKEFCAQDVAAASRGTVSLGGAVRFARTMVNGSDGSVDRSDEWCASKGSALRCSISGVGVLAPGAQTRPAIPRAVRSFFARPANL